MNEAELLFSELLHCDRLSLCLNKKSTLGKDKSALIASVLKRRIKGEPLQYILGKTEFMGLQFKVNRDVFIPRPETEILVETAIETVHSAQCTAHCALDLGTGSGCIAISLAKFLPGVKIDAIDISAGALKAAKENAELNNVSINFMQGDLFTTGLPAGRQASLPLTTYDLILSNPPYIASKQMDNLQAEVKYEPSIALEGGEDGLDFYRKIISQAPDFLQEGGFLIMEMGFNQRKGIEKIFHDSPDFQIIKVIKDYNNIDRAVVSRKIPKNG